MNLFTNEELGFARMISKLGWCNPFLPERVEYERELLGEDFVDGGQVWSLRPDRVQIHPNVELLTGRAGSLTTKCIERIEAGARFTDEEADLFEDLVIVWLYNRFQPSMSAHILGALERGSSGPKLGFYDEFARELTRCLDAIGRKPDEEDVAHWFACFFQLRRAFHHIFAFIVGASMKAARLRASVWQSVFTYDMRRYRRLLFNRMRDVATLITGPSGTGKELVARAIGVSRYIPFDPSARRFAVDFVGTFHPLNLSALSPTLIESELFGHRRGAFTGALTDRVGWFELCGPYGSVFLDEIGEVDPMIQVKLLRVLQTRTFQRLGGNDDRKFEGKIIAATNRDLETDIQQGSMRSDFFYRLCSDLIHTPSLCEQVAGSPEELRHLVLFIVQRVLGADEAESAALADEVHEWIVANLGADYSWPGNFRELEQCVRNVIIRRAYAPPRSRSLAARDALANDVWQGELTADEMLRRYCTVVYARTGGYQQAARRLDLDHRTVKSKIDEKLLEALRAEGIAPGNQA